MTNSSLYKHLLCNPTLSFFNDIQILELAKVSGQKILILACRNSGTGRYYSHSARQETPIDI